MGLSPVTVSQHIGILMGAKLVTVHNDGARTYYSLNKAGDQRLDRFTKKSTLEQIDVPQGRNAGS